MKKSIQIVLVTAVLVCGGCSDEVRKTVSPYLFTGLQTITSGLIAGLEQCVYPEGPTSGTEDSSSESKS